jgi:hypothetical protein
MQGKGTGIIDDALLKQVDDYRTIHACYPVDNE